MTVNHRTTTLCSIPLRFSAPYSMYGGPRGGGLRQGGRLVTLVSSEHQAPSDPSQILAQPISAAVVPERKSFPSILGVSTIGYLHVQGCTVDVTVLTDQALAEAYPRSQSPFVIELEEEAKP